MKKVLLTLIGFVGFIQITLATTCPGATVIPAAPALPYTQALACGGTNDMNGTTVLPVCGSTNYLGGNEAVYSWTPSSNYINVTMAYTGVNWTGIFVYAGCPTSAGSTCITNITSGGTSKVTPTFSATAGVTYFFVFDTWPTPDSPCPGNFTLNGSFGPPVAPAAPTQDPSLPSCATGTNLLATGTPPVNVSWFWQTTALGTNQALNASTPNTVFANGTYFLRAYNTVTLLWSATSSSVVVTNFPVASSPPAPTANFNPSCSSNGGSILTAAVAPAGTLYYWQGTNVTGSSTSLPATATYAAPVSGTYYLAAFETASQCWSNTTGLPVVVSTFIPSAPTTTAPDIYACTGATTAIINATAAGSGSVVLTLGTNVSFAGNGSQTFTGTLNIPLGATVTSSVLSFNNVTTAGGNWPSDLSCSMTGAATLASITVNPFVGEVTNAGPYTRFPTVIAGGTTSLLLTNNYSGTADFGSITLTVNYTLPATTINWYDLSVAGTQQGSGSPFETIPTAALPNGTTAGIYPFYAESVSGGCVSATRTLVNVNISPVSVVITPMSVTCNNGNDGTFSITAVDCGTAPFTYSVDGGTFGPAPTNLEVGTYSVVVMDGGSQISNAYNVVIGDALAPSGIIVNTFNNDQVDLSWIANGSETSWNVEWGFPGFIPGTGAEEGMATATGTNFLVTGLNGDTEYEFYVSANCGSGTTAGDWISTTQTTSCDPIIAQGWCESFDSNSPTQQCWTVLNANGDFTEWTMDDLNQPASGDECASINTDFNFGANDDWLITPLISLTGNEILTFSYRVLSQFDPNDFEVLLSTTGPNPANFTNTLMALDSYNNTVYQDTSINLSTFTGDVFIAFHIPNGGLDGWVLYIDDVCVDICVPAAGTDGTVDVCRLDGTLDLNTVITQGETNGVWNFAPNPTAVNGSDLTVTAIPDGLFTAEYIVTTACTMDTTVATFNIFPASRAGTDGVLNVCRNQQLNLLSGLTGIIDLGGTWYNPTNTAMPSGQINSGNLPGQFNYRYIAGNGVCPNDSSNIVLNVSATCNALGLEEFVFEGITIFPNPNNGVFTIANTTSGQTFSYEIADLNGRVIKTAKEVNGLITTEVDLSKVENGIYMVRIFNAEGEKMERIVKQ